MASMDSERRAAGERRQLRRHFREQRRRIPPSEQAAHAEAVAKHFFASLLPLSGRSVGAYFSNDAEGELSTAPLLARLLSTRKRVALPVAGRDGSLTFYRYRRSTSLTPNRFGILEPAQSGRAYVAPLSLRVLLVPLVAFDHRGVRLGMGAGYYDRYLGRIPYGLRPRLVGLAHEAQRSPLLLPFAAWDVPLDSVVTEKGWQTFDH